MIAETDGSRSVEDDLVRGMLDRQIDGLVYGCLSTKRVQLSTAVTELPVVLLNCLADPAARDPPSIPDEVGGGREAARGLLAAGHRDGIYVIGRRPREVLAAGRRMRGIRAGARRGGCCPRRARRLRVEPARAAAQP